LWRFDINSLLPGPDAFKIAQLTGPSGNAVSITSRPELGKVDGRPVVFVGTGRMLGATDMGDSSPQSFFAIQDDLAATTSPLHPSLRSNLVLQPVMSDGTARVAPPSAPTVDWALKAGWVVDLPDSGERNNTDPLLVAGTVVFKTNVPGTASVCAAGGHSWTYYLDYRSGTAVDSADASQSGYSVVAVKDLAFSTKVVGVSVGGKVQGIRNNSIGQVDVRRIPISRKTQGVQANWRELIIDR
jgi:type IV pilus assembly protein PilY1